MAYVVSRPNGMWELRESRSTERGPRSRTLVSFRELDEEAIAQGVKRSGGVLEPGSIRAICRRAGAPVALPRADRAAATLLAELVEGRPPSEKIAAPLSKALSGQRLSEAERAIAEWNGASPVRRGRAIWDLLLLADRIPSRRRTPALRFPPFAKHGR